MSERADGLLKMSGLHEVLIASLERSDVVFALTNQTLLYQDAGGTRRVTLRDLTRIHSDQDGTLRVETPAGTALTATLVGFDPVDVQTFFGQVRDTTARVKQLPAAPSTPTASIPTPGQPAPAPTLPSTPPPVVTPAVGRTPEAAAGFQESVTIIRSGANSTNQSASNQTQITPPPPRAAKAPTLIIPPPASTTEIRGNERLNNERLGGARVELEPKLEEVRSPTLITAPPAANPAAPISPATPVTSPATPPAPQPKAPSQIAPPPAAKAAPVAPASAASAEAERLPADAEVTDSTPAAAPRIPVSAAGTLAALAAHAESTRAWVGRLRFMAVIMLLAALALAYLQFGNGNGLSGVWVLIAGGMSAVGLYALADLTKLLTSLASAVSAEGGVMDVD